MTRISERSSVQLGIIASILHQFASEEKFKYIFYCGRHVPSYPPTVDVYFSKVDGFAQQRSGFIPVGFVVDKMELW
jgi:hypothetical protein